MSYDEEWRLDICGLFGWKTSDGTENVCQQLIVNLITAISASMAYLYYVWDLDNNVCEVYIVTLNVYLSDD